MKTVVDAIKLVKKRLETAKIPNSLYEAELIIAKVLSIPRLEIYLHSTNSISLTHLNFIEDIVTQRKQYRPLQYIFKETNFMGIDLLIDSTVFIPRFETELLVQKIINDNTVAIKPRFLLLA